VQAVRAALSACVSGHDPGLEVELRVHNQKHDSYHWVVCRGLAIPGENGRIGRIVGSFSDIDARKQHEELLRQGALYDELTGLANRKLFGQRLEDLVRTRTPGQRCAVLFCDLDGFKQVNDQFGHAVGDQLLTAVAGRLTATLRGHDLVARLGGDEFAVLMNDTGKADLDDIVDRLEREVSQPYRLGRREVTIGISIGAATESISSGTAQAILSEADAAMYRVKERHRRVGAARMAG
jgi:diguanylate cyclase (GGDEF)-like protein